jgi:hypothetical protein
MASTICGARTLDRIALIVLTATLAGCVSIARGPAPPRSSATAPPAGVPSDVRRMAFDLAQLEGESAEVVGRLRRASSDGTLDILALSGGGAGGAFGAGALVGLTRSGHRPQFEVVTGVSAGAVIAPFAFLGPSWDVKLTEALAGAGTSGLLVRRSVDVLFRPSLYRGRPVAAFIERAISDELIDAVARESQGGRLLLVATTDLDKGASVIWSLGAIARQNSAASRALFRKVLVASSSIPGVFPPVLIASADAGRAFEEMHVDGGITVAFFVAPEVAHVVPGAFRGLDGANLYVVMNTQNIMVPESTEGRLGPILERGSMTALNQLARSQLQLVSAFAREQGMSFHMTEIPADYPYRGTTDFRPEAMRALFDYGADCAERDRLWTSLPESMRRAEEAVRRLESESTAKERGDARVPCPAELRDR